MHKARRNFLSFLGKISNRHTQGKIIRSPNAVAIKVVVPQLIWVWMVSWTIFFWGFQFQWRREYLNWELLKCNAVTLTHCSLVLLFYIPRRFSDAFRGYRKVTPGCNAVTLTIEPCQPEITCSKLIIETLEQGVKYNRLVTEKKFPYFHKSQLLELWRPSCS